MIFNPQIDNILKDMNSREVITTDQIGLCKLILFCFDQGINLPNYVKTDTNTLQELISKLVYARLIERDYDLQGNVQLSLPIYIDAVEEEVSEINTSNVKVFVETNIDMYRALFSKKKKGTTGLRHGSLGDRQACIDKLIKWFKKTRFKYSWKEVLDSTEYYVSLQKPNNYTYLQNADYFIYKNNRSNLSVYIEESKNPQTNTNWNREHI